MRKHFLILMLLTLFVPFAGYADEYEVVLYNASKTYGDLDQDHPLPGWLKFTPAAATADAKLALANELNFLRAGGDANQGENVGTYRYIVEDADLTTGDDFLVSGDAAYTIKARKMEATSDWIAFELKNPKYKSATAFELTAADFKVTVTLPINNNVAVELTEGVDFTIAAQGDNANLYGANAGSITIKGIGNYTGTKQFTYDIQGTDISTLPAAVYNGPALTYKGVAYTTDDTQFANANFSITGYTAGTHFQVKAGSIENGTNAGNLTIKLEGIEAAGFSGTQTVTIPIQKYVVPANGLTYTPGEAPLYTKSALAPVGTFKVTGTELPNLAETDFEFVESTLDINASTTNKADLVFKSGGNYEFAAGTTKQEITYEIAKRPFTAATITASFAKDANNTEITDYPYNNKAIKPAVTVTFLPEVGATPITLVENTDFTLAYAGKATATDLKSVENDKTLTITGKGNFTTAALAVKNYNVVVRPLKVKAVDMTVGMGAEVTPQFTYDSWASGENLATIGTQAVKYKNRTTNTEYTQDQIQAAPQGEYDIIPLATGYTVAAKYANYAFEAVHTPTYGTLTKTISQVVVKIVDREITWGENFPNAGWTVEHVSGLSEADQVIDATDGKTTAIESIIATIDQNKFGLVNAAADPLDANADGYAVSYDGAINTGDYVASVTNGKLVVKKYEIQSTDIAIDDADLDYTGKAVAPTVTLTINGDVISPKYYTVTYDQSFKAGERTAKIVANTANYTTAYTREAATALEAAAYNADNNLEAGDDGYKNAGDELTLAYAPQTYTIDKINLEITVDDFTGAKAWTYGKPEPTYTASLTDGEAVEGEESLITSLLAGNQPTGFNAKLAIKRTSANTVGNYTNALEASWVDAAGAPFVGDAADNYNIVLLPGNLEVKKGKIIAKVKDITLAWNGTNNPAAGTFQLEAVEGMDPAEAANFDAIVTYDNAIAKFGYTNDYRNIGPHTLAYTGATPTATNYDVELAEGDAAKGTLTVVKRPVTFKAINQNIAYGAAFNPAVNDTYVDLIDNTDSEYDAATCYTLLPGTTMTDLIASVAAESMNVGENVIKLTAKNSDYYDIHVLPGVLTIANTGINIVLHRVAKADFDDPLKNTAASVIETNDGKFVNATFTFPGQTMYANKWYTMVLPFATTVREISNAFGYAVVDVFNTNGNDPDDVSFSLHIGTVNANEPFLIKIDEDITADDFEGADGPEFKNVKIENAASLELSDAYGNKIVGTYSGINGGFDEDYDWGLGLGQSATDWQSFSSTYLRPLGAYIHYKDRQMHNARTITIEEPDGTTTVINSITGDQQNFSKDAIYNMNGVKMQGIPTEKGVYIQNGKKIVIK